MTAKDIILAWARSPGFAAIHNGAATDEQIADDLLAWLEKTGFEITSRYGRGPTAIDSEIAAEINQRLSGVKS